MNEPTTLIASHSNLSYRRLLALHTGRGIKREGSALVCGRRIVREVLSYMPERVVALAYPCKISAFGGDSFEPPEHDPEIVPPDWSGTTISLTTELFKDVDLFGTGAPLAVIETEPLATWEATSQASGVTLFLPFGDPENLGAALRSAAAFGVDRVVLLEEAAHPYHPRAIRASAGAVLRLEVLKGPSLQDLIVDPPASLYALDSAGENISLASPGPDFGLVIGEEGRGLPPLGGIAALAIPIDSKVESLNAAVATGIALATLCGNRS